jgi:hypothetical protein
MQSATAALEYLIAMTYSSEVWEGSFLPTVSEREGGRSKGEEREMARQTL